MQEPDQFYLDKDEPTRSCLLALRSIILEQDQQVTEKRKYGMPGFCYKQKMFWTDKKSNEPYILMVEGKHLHHPALEQGNRSRMKILRIDPSKDLPLPTIVEILEEGLELYRAGTISMKKWLFLLAVKNGCTDDTWTMIFLIWRTQAQVQPELNLSFFLGQQACLTF